MKRLIRPHVIVVGIVVAALVALSGVASAAGVNVRSQTAARSSALPQAETSPEMEHSLAPEPEHQNVAPAVPEAAEPEVEHQVAVQTPPPSTAAVSSRTFALVGGTVTFRCTGNAISLVSATPNSGFSVETETEIEHGLQQIKVKFESQMNRSEIRAGCVGGQVQATSIREESR
jgi:hypothetical protein